MTRGVGRLVKLSKAIVRLPELPLNLKRVLPGDPSRRPPETFPPTKLLGASSTLKLERSVFLIAGGAWDARVSNDQETLTHIIGKYFKYDDDDGKAADQS